MSGISDPGKAGRGDKRRAQKLIDAAYAAGTLTAADRALRIDRVSSAHTKGDLAILVRDLNRAAGSAPAAAAAGASVPDRSTDSGSASLGSAIPPEKLAAMARGTSARTIQLGESMRSAMTGDGVRTVRRVVLIVIVGFVLMCGLGIAAIVGLVASGINQAFDAPEPTSSLSLHTAEGWTEMVAAVEGETGTSRVYDAVVYPDYASVNVEVDEGAMRYVYRGGIFDLFESPVTPVHSDPIDLADIDPDLVEALPGRTAKEHEMTDFESAYLILGAATGEPTIIVYLQKPDKLPRWTIYDLDGTVVSGMPH